MTLGTLAIVATRGTSNNLFQVATLVRAATALNLSVGVFFRDEAALKLRRDRINEPEWAPVYRRIAPQLQERLRAAEFGDMETFLRDAKEHGDDVLLWVSAETMEAARLTPGDLTSVVDGVVTEASFRERLAQADAFLTF